VKGKGAYSSLWIGNPSQSYGASPATVHPAKAVGRWNEMPLNGDARVTPSNIVSDWGIVPPTDN